MRGEVLVNGAAAMQGMVLQKDDRLTTGSGSDAQVIFFDASVLRIKELSDITIKEMTMSPKTVQLRQDAGDTWSRVLKIAGIASYEVETPTTVATVRGTGFGVRVHDGRTAVAVGDGVVGVAQVQADRIIAEVELHKEQQVVVEEIEVTALSPGIKDIELNVEVLDEDPFIEENLEQDEEFIDEMVEHYIEEHPEITQNLGQGTSVKDIKEHVEGLVTGQGNDVDQEADKETIMHNDETTTQESEESHSVVDDVQEDLDDIGNNLIVETGVINAPEEGVVNVAIDKEVSSYGEPVHEEFPSQEPDASESKANSEMSAEDNIY